MKPTRFLIAGMHCPSCELLIRESIEDAKIDGTIDALSFKTGELRMTLRDEREGEKVEAAIRNAGYTLRGDEKENPSRFSLSRLLFLIPAAIVLWGFLQLDTTRFIPSFDTLSLPIAFLIGLVASVSTCLTVTGGIVIGYSASIDTKKDIWKTQLQFHVGRILAFAVGGFILGMIGTTFHTSLWLASILNILIGVIILSLGLQTLGIMRSIGFTLPASIGKGILTIKNPRYAMIVGALTFFLPCGFTQSMQIFALESADPIMGALILATFALGTFPVLLGLGLGTEYIRSKLKILNPLIASLLIVFGIFTIMNGFHIISGSIQSTETQIQNGQETNVAEREVRNISHDGTRFIPSPIVLQQGKTYTLRVTPTSDGLGCFYALAYEGKSYDIKKGQPFEITVVANTPKKIPLRCAAMGMTMGMIEIVE